jgi:hypothetical protein
MINESIKKLKSIVNRNKSSVHLLEDSRLTSDYRDRTNSSEVKSKELLKVKSERKASL